MGQQTIGVMYGSRRPAGVPLYDDYGPDDDDDAKVEGIIDSFDSERRERGDDPWDRNAVRFGHDENTDVLGAWAIDSLKWVEPSLKAVDLADTAAWIESIAASERGQEAVKLWDQFVEFAKARGVDLGPATWWLAEHEVA